MLSLPYLSRSVALTDIGAWSLDMDRPCLNIPAELLLALTSTMTQLCAASDFRLTVDPVGSYLLCGWSAGCCCCCS